MSSTLRCDQAEIIRALTAILESGQITEMRALEATIGRERYQQTLSGYFDDPAKLAAAAASITSAKGIYFIPNEPNPALLARAKNRIRPVKKEPTTSDGDIIRRRWLLVDCDPVRPSGISSSDAEHEAAIEMALTIRDAMMKQGWPEPISGDSGNGGHLLWRVDLFADDGGLCERCLKALAKRFSAPQVKIDVTTFNPARIWRLYGCVNGKGDSTAERPHRMARMLSAPEDFQAVPMELLKALATEAVEPEQPAKPSNRKVNGHSFNIDDFRRQHFPHAKEQPYKGGRKWQITCPFNPDHHSPDAVIYEMASGALGFKCSHNGCTGKLWEDVRELLQPGCYDRRHEGRGKAAGVNGAASKDNPRIVAPVLVWMKDVQPVPVQWLWPHRIPLARATVLCGKPGEGKSFAALDIAARVTTGSPWPDGTGNAPMGNVLVVMPEDNDEDTTRVRLDAMHADSSKIAHLAGVRRVVDEGDPQIVVFTLSDVKAFREAVEIVKPMLAIIDPIGSAIGGKVDAHRDNEVRASLAPALALATEYKFALLLIAHRRKSAGESADDVVLGSRAFTGLARVVWHLSHDKLNEQRRLLLPGKNNLAAKQDGLAFTIAGDPPTIIWEREGVKMSADEGMAAEHDEERDDGRVETDEWLRAELADVQEHAVKDLKQSAKEAGIGWRGIEKASKRLGVRYHRATFGGGYVWRLPKTACSPHARQHPLSGERGEQGEHGISTVQSTTNITPCIPCSPPDLSCEQGEETAPAAPQRKVVRL